MQTNFRKLKNDVLDSYQSLLKNVEAIGYSRNDESLKYLAGQDDKIKADRFCLMVAGEAKSGKSTFINAYLGTEILPMDVKQCTSSMVEIQYGEQFYLEASYADSSRPHLIVRGEDDVQRFLRENAAVDDNYRDIPVSTIVNNLLIPRQGRPIYDKEIDEFISNVRDENIHHLSDTDYASKIRTFINNKNSHWNDIVTKISIYYPFTDENMRGVHIVDSPGVNAAGRVGDVSEDYIKTADAIMFLRPLTGQAIEANSFKNFLESSSVDRNKGALFLVLTRIASESDETINKAMDEFIKMYGTAKYDTSHGVTKDLILPVDSKAELYRNHYKDMPTEEINEEITRNGKHKMEAFVRLAWMDSQREKDEFLNELRNISRFDAIDTALDKFGRKSQYYAFSQFLARIIKVYSKITSYLDDQIDSYKLKFKDPEQLEKKEKILTDAVAQIENDMTETTQNILDRYCGSSGMIAEEAEKITKSFREEISGIDKEDGNSIDELKKIAFRKIDDVTEFETRMEKELINSFNTELKHSLENKSFSFSTDDLQPDITADILEKLKEEAEEKATVRIPYEKGHCFNKHTEYLNELNNEKYFLYYSDSISSRLDGIKAQAIKETRAFANRIKNAYIGELRKNADQKKNDIRKVEEDKRANDEISKHIQKLEAMRDPLTTSRVKVEELKGGVDQCINTNH